MIDSDRDIKRQVREFYDRVGWKEVSEGVFQNARYEDLRPVSQEYIHRCHQRVARHLASKGRFFLDAGSGPIQYPEYIEYSKGYDKRVCADVSHTALKAARQRVGDHGLFVVADISNLPFSSDVFEGIVSLHTIHHLPQNQHVTAYEELHRVLAKGCTAVVVNGWDHSRMMGFFNRIKRVILRTRHRRFGRKRGMYANTAATASQEGIKGTFVEKHDPGWLKLALNGRFEYRVLVWRSAGTNFLRFFIRERWFGRYFLRLLFRLEELFPRYFGEVGRYPMLVVTKAK
ncbi:MAG: class I SAM-dependent methyltransferase [Anaerolineales bacterium]